VSALLFAKIKVHWDISRAESSFDENFMDTSFEKLIKNE
jgi:hypothetical protein